MFHTQELAPNITKLDHADSVTGIWGVARLIESVSTLPYTEIRKQMGVFIDPRVKETSLFVARSIFNLYDTPGSDSEIAGFAATKEEYDEGVTGLHIKHMIVDPDQRRRGLGSQLMNACVEHSRALGHGYIVFDDEYESHAAQQLLESHKFKQIGTDQPVLILK